MSARKQGFRYDTYCSRANLIDSSTCAVLDLIYAITWSIQIIVKLGLDAGVERGVVICIPGENATS